MKKTISERDLEYCNFLLTVSLRHDDNEDAQSDEEGVVLHSRNDRGKQTQDVTLKQPG